MANTWRTGRFDFFLVVAQITGVVGMYYVFSGLITWFGVMLFGGYHATNSNIVNNHLQRYTSSVQLGYLLDGNTLIPEEWMGWVQCGVFLLTSCVIGAWISVLVQRAKQCFDFACTLYAIHFILCWSLYGFPTTPMWWFVNVTSLIVTSVLSEYLCLQKELTPIALSGSRGNFK